MTVERATTPRQATQFRVLDAETMQSVAGARVVAVHHFDLLSDWVVNGTTDESGATVLRLFKPHLNRLTLDVYAGGYVNRYGLGFSNPGVREAGDGSIEIFMYREPDAAVGWRFPAGFRGVVVVGSTEPVERDDVTIIRVKSVTDQTFPFPPDFPRGQRIWWSDIRPGKLNHIEPPPRLGDVGRNSYPIPQAVVIGDLHVPIPEPGADVTGPAVWHIGVREPRGPWGGTDAILIIGDRTAALAEARAMWRLHRNGATSYVFNGWLEPIGAELKTIHPQAYGVTRTPAP